MLTDLLTLLWIHFIADFLLQSDSMALNKSKSNKWLLSHVLTYSLPFFWWGVSFAVITGGSHFCIDWITSRGTSKLWQADQRHWFFVLIGFDQAIHLTILALTFKYIC